MAPRTPRRSDRTRSGTTRRTSRPRRERGASLPEYALLVALLAVPSVAGIDALRSGAGDTAEGTADRISDPTIPTVPPTSSTAPPATTTTTTTTTMPPTTTTTHHDHDHHHDADDDAADDHHDDDGACHAVDQLAELTEHLDGVQPHSVGRRRPRSRSATNGAPWSRARPSRSRSSTARGSDTWSTAPNLNGTTTSTGALLLDSGFYNSSGGSRVDEIRFQVTSVTKSGMTWQTNNTRVTASRPN